MAAAGMHPDWIQVQHKTASLGTTWRFIPPGAPWHNGQVERMIGLLKASVLRQVHAGAVLDFCQLQVLFHRVSYLMNERPLSARSFSKDDFCAITPNDLLLGAAPSKSTSDIMDANSSADTVERLAARVAIVDERVASWWTRFFKDVFPLLVPRGKWALERRNVRPGDIVLVQFQVKYAVDKNSKTKTATYSHKLEIKTDGQQVNYGLKLLETLPWPSG